MTEKASCLCLRKTSRLLALSPYKTVPNNTNVLWTPFLFLMLDDKINFLL